MSKKIYPFQELFDNGNWKVVEGPPSVNYITETITVPLGDNQTDHNIRIHTQARIKWDFDLTNVGILSSPETIQAVNNLRVTHILQRKAGVDTTFGYTRPTEAIHTLKDELQEDNLRNQVLLIVKNGRTRISDILLKVLEESDKDQAEFAVDIVKEVFNVIEAMPDLTAEDVKTLCTLIDERIQEVTTPIESESGSPNKSNVDFIGTLEQMHAHGMRELVNHLSTHKWRIDKKYNEWGKLKWERPAVTEFINARRIQRRSRSSEDGIVLQDYTRVWTDNKIWRAVTRVQGGAVLIDCSNSMQFRKSQIESLVRAAPALRVALYSGDGKTGVIREVVRNGRLCDASLLRAPGGHYNVVDGPCIEEWLALQASPRIWISDGWVNGLDGHSSKNLFDDVLNLCKKYNIIRVNHIQSALELFAKLERGEGIVHPVLRHKQNADIELIKN